MFRGVATGDGLAAVVDMPRFIVFGVGAVAGNTRLKENPVGGFMQYCKGLLLVNGKIPGDWD